MFSVLMQNAVSSKCEYLAFWSVFLLTIPASSEACFLVRYLSLYVRWHSCGTEYLWTVSSIVFPLYFLLPPNQIRACSSAVGWGTVATNRKVAGSILDGVLVICLWHNPSGRTMALRLTQPLTEMSTRDISWGVKAAGALGWQPYHLHVPIVLKSGSLNLLASWNPQGLSSPVMGLLYLFLPNQITFFVPHTLYR